MLSCLLANQQGQLNLRQLFQQAVQPQLCTLATRRLVTAVDASGITKAHRNNRDLRLVVKCGRVDPEQVPKTVATRVVPRDARCVHARPAPVRQAGCARPLPHARSDEDRVAGAAHMLDRHARQPKRIERRTRVLIPATSFPGHRHEVCVAHQRTPTSPPTKDVIWPPRLSLTYRPGRTTNVCGSPACLPCVLP